MQIGKSIAAGALALALSSTAAFAAESSAAPLSSAELGEISAGMGAQMDTTQVVSASNDGSSITAGQVTAGAVNISNGALSGFNGIGNVVINTGNNNNIQGTMSVIVLASPPV